MVIAFLFTLISSLHISSPSAAVVSASAEAGVIFLLELAVALEGRELRLLDGRLALLVVGRISLLRLKVEVSIIDRPQLHARPAHARASHFAKLESELTSQTAMYAASLKWISLLYLTTVFCNSNAQCKAEVTVLLVNATTVNITWTLSPCSFNDSSSHTTNYYLRWRLEGLCSSTESYQNIFIVNETFYILTGLKEDSEYSVYVDTQYYNGTLKSSDEKCFNTAQG